ncbi:SMI1/KNR4 family protein [Flammeovirga aprica]|uniref:SMI1/KNR4 family protein n=1 Tax=Flammeovirga aprica JL-4 TaxID=694437 RepID=A0A7X9S0J2_9BACT|nr:SMI1/KNR4 family protein [Flammeovirga aprica]NME72109.1 SMI1/KNR4 family protein [Flammeovirga aprica JL-4]
MKELESIWQKPIYLSYLQPKLTDEIIEGAEQKLGYKLPNEFIELLKVQNGGYIRKNLEESVNDKIYGIGPYFPSITDVDWEEYKDWVSFELEGLIPFDGDGHWYICLDYRNNKSTPEITYVDTECDNQEKVADSFSDYLSQLTLGVDDELVISTNDTISEISNQLESILNIRFEEPDSFAHGYDEYRSKLDSSWIWLSPNLVPKGFVRKNEDRYEELVKLSEGKATRFPEIPETSLLISFSEEKTRDFVIEKLRDKQIEINSLKEIIEKKL